MLEHLVEKPFDSCLIAFLDLDRQAGAAKFGAKAGLSCPPRCKSTSQSARRATRERVVPAPQHRGVHLY